MHLSPRLVFACVLAFAFTVADVTAHADALPRSGDSTNGGAHESRAGLRLLDQAQAAFDHANHPRAIAHARRSLHEDALARAGVHHALYLIYASHERMGEPEEALRHCQKALRLGGSRKWQHLNNCARLRLHLGDYEGAIADLREAMALIDPSQDTDAKTASGRSAGHHTLARHLEVAMRGQAAANANIASADERPDRTISEDPGGAEPAFGDLGALESPPAAPAR